MSLIIPTFAFASINSNLSYGTRGAAVTELQQFLIKNGFLTGQATGNFFGLTQKAVVAYQASVGLPSTGFVGALTRAKINAVAVAPIVSTGTISAAPVAPAVTTPVASTPIFDACKNINGAQAAIPSGMYGDGNGNCLPIPIYTPTPTTITPPPTPPITPPVASVPTITTYSVGASTSSTVQPPSGQITEQELRDWAATLNPQLAWKVSVQTQAIKTVIGSLVDNGYTVTASD